MRTQPSVWRRRLTLVLSALLVVALAPGMVALAQTPDPLAPEESLELTPLAPGHTRFTGVIEAVPEGSLVGDWTVAGLTVRVSRLTQIIHPPDAVDASPLGKWAVVEGVRDRCGATDAATEVPTERCGGVEARLIRILPPYVHLVGPVLSIPEGELGTWNIAGQSVLVDEQTRLGERTRRIGVGTWVDVLGLEREGVLWAQRIVATSALPAPTEELARSWRRVQATGAIQSATSGTWTLSTMTIHTTDSTRVLGPQRVGLVADVVGTMSSEGRLVAQQITVRWEESQSTVGRLVRFEGTIERIPAGRLGPWTVSGRTVTVSERTRIVEDKGQAVVGARVSVAAWQSPSVMPVESLEALLIVVLAPAGTLDFTGVVQRRPPPPLQVGTWRIADRLVMVSPHTRIDETVGPALVGATVRVKGAPYLDTLVMAQEIIVVAPAPPVRSAEPAKDEE